MSDVGETLAALREDHHLTRYALAKLAGVHRNSVADIEEGQKAPSLDTARKLCEALGVSLAVFDRIPVD